MKGDEAPVMKSCWTTDRSSVARPIVFPSVLVQKMCVPLAAMPFGRFAPVMNDGSTFVPSMLARPIQPRPASEK